MVLFISLVIAGWILLAVSQAIIKWLQKQVGRFRLRTNLFDHQYIEGKQYYINRFRDMPCISLVDDIDLEKVYDHILANYSDKIIDVYQYNDFNHDKGIQEFRKTFFVLSNKVIIELYYGFAQLFFNNRNFGFANEFISGIQGFKAMPKKEEYEINIIMSGFDGLQLKQLDVKTTTLDIDLYYNDDFAAVDELIRKRLSNDNDKGIVLLHGLPGTGKTTYLRHLIGTLKKKVLFVSPSVAGNLMDPNFIELLIDNPNAVLVIEDAENVIMDRKVDSNSSVSNLLNISDGLLSDCLNVQIICTFNNALSMVDTALMRKGRLIAKYEFGRLSTEKAQKLSNHLGYDKLIQRPMTLAEITNQHEADHQVTSTQVIGFRREQLMLEN